LEVLNMNLEEKLNTLLEQIKSLLDEAEAFIGESKFEDAKAKQDEAASLEEQASVIKAQIEARKGQELTELQDRVDELERQNKEPVKPPFKEIDSDEVPNGSGDQEENEVAKAFNLLRYGEIDPAAKAVLHDIYGREYHQKMWDQRNAFLKYIRTGMVSSKEWALLTPSGKNIILSPEQIKAEIGSGRSVGELKVTLEEGSHELGGALVPEDFRAQIIQRLRGLTVVRGRARGITTTRDAVEFPRLEGGNSRYTSAARGTWVDETPADASVAETNPTFGTQRIPVHTYMIRTNVSKNLLEDAAFDLFDYLADLFADTRAIDEDDAFLVGDGGGKPEGVLGGLQSGAQRGPVTGVGTTTSGDASLLTADGLMNTVYVLDTQYRGSAVWVGAKNTIRDTRKLKDGEGNYLWAPGLQPGQPDRLLGFGVAESEAMPAIGANAYPVIFGDFRRGYVLVDRVGMSVQRVEDTTTTGQNQVALFARARVGGQVVAPWAFAALQIAA
jgi:HK97 family phage major capsid protein